MIPPLLTDIDLSFLTFANLDLTNLLGAAFIAIAGLILVQTAIGLLGRFLRGTQLAPGNARLVSSVVRVVLIALILITVAAKLDIPITSFVATLSVLGIAISLAVQDGLKNVAGSILMRVSRPFVPGDFVEIGDVSGTVEEIGPLATRLITPDNRRVTYPNGLLTNSVVVNYSSMETRRLDLALPIGQDNDIERVLAIILAIVQAHPMAQGDPAPLVRMDDYKPHSIEILLRVWTLRDNLFTLKWDLLERIKAALDEAGVCPPCERMEILRRDEEASDNSG